MPHTKKPSQRANYRGGGGRPRGGQSNNGTDSPRRGHVGFTLQEEARNTERHHSVWDTDKRLRDTKVSFVSAGTLGSTKPKDAEAALANMTLNSDDADNTQTHTLSESSAAAQKFTDLQIEQAILQCSTDIQEIPDFVVDTEGGELVNTGIRLPRLRSVSPTPSDSSEEVILFRGRDRHGRGLSEAHHTTRTTTNTIDAKIRIVEDRIHEREELLQEVLRRKEHSVLPQVPAEVPSTEKETESQRHKQPGHPAQQNRLTSRKQADEDAILADYIANMESQDIEPFESLRQRELGGSADDVWQGTGESSGDALTRTKKPSQAGWGPTEIFDMDDLSTSDGVMGDVLAILSKRERQTGLQYLVVWEDQTVDEARWVPVNTLTSLSALRHIEKFEAEEKLVAEFQHDDDDDTSDTDEANIDDEDDEYDEDGFIEKRIEGTSDEQIARLLAKQEELGMGSAELILFDEEAGVDEDEDLPFPRTLLAPIMLPSKTRRSRGAGSQRARGDFPPASLLADAYDGFDVMDFDRPNLKKKRKGRKGKPDFDLSDSELEASMQMAWDNDRVKKKKRKQEREELRAQGLLGSKNGKPDLKQKYKEGMGIHAVKEELKKFLMGTDATLALPPMDVPDRKVVHELARAFNVKSKSAGSGNVRFPVWHRTTRTSVYVERNFNAIEERLSRGFLPRLDVNSKKSGAGHKRVKGGGGGGSNKASVSYRDGDVVGGSAPELGAENRGRAMLEKMGWSSGTALGALNNKGILQPVSHVVKTTKAGLG